MKIMAKIALKNVFSISNQNYNKPHFTLLTESIIKMKETENLRKDVKKRNLSW